MGGRRMDGRRRFVSSRDVAERAGVSRSAVSRAFTPGASIAPATLKRVQAAANALGYEVNDLARGLLADRSHIVGLVTSDPATPFRAETIAALSCALIARGNVPAIITIGPTADDLANASRQLLRYRAEATIFCSGSPPAELIELARRNSQPLILINRAETGLDAVRCDDRGGARQVFAALRQSGALRLGLISTEKPSASLRAREQVFLQLAAKASLPVEVGRAERSDYGGGVKAARQLLDAHKRPHGVFCVNDLMAFGALDHVRGQGLAVPEDMSIIGFDDVAMASWSAYDLTTVRQDPERVAKDVLAILDRRRANPGQPPITALVPVELVRRGTVKA